MTRSIPPQRPAWLVLSLLVLAVAAIAQPPSAHSPIAASESYGRLPLNFEANQGQTDPSVQFLVHGQGYTLFLRPGEAALALQPANANSGAPVVQIKLAGANLKASAVAEDPQVTRTNYFLGNDPTQWRTGIPNYSRVRYRSVYPGVDLVYYGNQRRLEYDFVVAPRANPRTIRMHFVGAHLKLDSTGNLEIAWKDGKVVFERPVIYQEINGGRQPVSGAFRLLDDSTMGFRIGVYDRSRPLIIDPVLSYSTYVNGASIAAMAVDAAGDVYVTGVGWSIATTAGAFQGTNNCCTFSKSLYGGNAFVTKLNPTGTAALYSTYIGGSGAYPYDGGDPPAGVGDGGTGIAVDAAGNAYVAGFTYSFNFPVKNPLQAQNNAASYGNDNAFVAELNATGSALVYSTYLGGSGCGNGDGDGATGLALDATGAAYIVGNTCSPDFPTTPGALQSGGAIFLAKFAPNGTSLAYSTTFGAGYVYSNGIAIDSSGAAYVTGYTYPQNGGGITVTPGAYQATNHSAYQSNAFVAKLNPTGTALGYATYLGGSGRNYTDSRGATSNLSDQGNAIAVDSSGNAYVTGSAGSGDFPITSGALQANNVSPAGLTNAFITKMNPTGTALVYSTYLGGTGSAGAPPVTNSPQGYGDQGTAIAVDTAGDAYVSGWTGSADFPVTTNAYQSTNGALANKNTNAFVSKLNPAGSELLYSTYLGGSGSSADYSQGDSASAVGFDTSGHIYVGGNTNSVDFPTTSGAFDTTGGSGFVSQLDPGAGSQYALSITPATLEVFAGQVGTASNATPVTITNIGSADVTINGISIAGTNAAEFTQTNTCGTALAAKGSCTVSVIFTPTTAGRQTATLSIADNATGSPQSVALIGNETVYPPDPVLSTTLLAFGTQAAGSSTTQTVTLTNQGKGALDITSIATESWWSQTNTCGTTLAAGASCTINVTFTPQAAGASTTATLVVEDNANSSPQQVSLSGSGTAVDVIVGPLSLNFAAQAVGTTSPAQMATVTNYSAVPITFSAISATGDFAVTNNCSGPVPTNSSCSALVTFKPTATGIRTGVLTVTESASSRSWQIALNGAVPPITLTPTALTFAAQAVGTTSDVQIVKVAYTGQGASYAISSIVVSGDFVWNKDINFSCEGATLSLDSYCNVEVAFKPTAAGTRTGTLTIRDTASNSPQTAALTGTGVGPLTLSATTLSFAQQAVGSKSAPQTVTLTNSGQATLTIASITASGDFAETNTCRSPLPAGATCNIAVTFTPTATGTRNGMLTITDTATGSPQVVALSGSGITPSTTAELQFIPVTPCRIADTRNATGAFGAPKLAAGVSRAFDIQQSACNIPATAVAYSLNVTVVPDQSLGYLTLWPSGQAQPNVSTLNSDGRVKANATITPAGTNGGVSVYVTDATQFILDIDGYFVPAGTSTSGLEFYPLTQCRIADTRNATGPLGGPFLAGNTSRAFPLQSGACGIPSTAKAYSLNVTAVPHSSLGYLTAWPSGQPQPVVSTLNSSTGSVTANAAIVPAGVGGDVSIYVSDDADAILDVNGYFAPPASGGLSFYTVTPCRALDTRSGSGAFDGTLTVPVQTSPCVPSATAQTYVLNATVLPTTTLSYMTVWPAGASQPDVSTLNAGDGAITSNMALVTTTNGTVDAFATESTNLLLDLSGYFAP